MRALQVTEHGDPSRVLKVVLIDRPEPGPRQLRIRVAAGSLNFNDIDRCRGRLTSVPIAPPFTLGMDVCGVVDAAGAGAEDWVGRRVVAVTQMAMGGLAEYALAPLDSVFDAPPELDDAEATAFVLTSHTAALALFERGRLRAGETLLVHAGASGVGSAAIQLGVSAGARVIATARGERKLALCRELGAELAIDPAQQDFTTAVLDHTGDVGAQVVCDLVGGSFAVASWRCTAQAGRYLAVGFADDAENGMGGQPLRPACMANISILGVLSAYMSELPGPIRRMGLGPFSREVGLRVHADLLARVAKGELRPVVGARVPLEEAGAALEAHEQRRSIGRSVVLVGG